MWILNNRLNLGGVCTGRINMTMTDGTRIMVLKVFKDNIVFIDSPFPIPGRQEEEKFYYLRCGYLISEVQPEHEYRFHKIDGVDLPLSLDEMMVDGTDSEIIQAYYFLKDNRKHRTEDSGGIDFFPEVPNESFGSGTVNTPHATANWNAYHTKDYFDRWLETVAIETYDAHTEDLSGWDAGTGTGTRTYTATNTYKLTYTDKDGAHTIFGFMISANSGSITRTKTMGGVGGLFFQASSIDSSQTANRPTIGTPTAMGNSLTLRLVRDLSSLVDGDLSASWVFDHFDADLDADIYNVTWEGIQSRSYSGPVSLYLGAVLVDTADISLTQSDSIDQVKEGRQFYDEPGHTPGAVTMDLPDVTQAYDRDEYTFSVLTWTNIQDAVFGCLYKKIRYVESWDRVDILYSQEALLQLWQADGNIARYFQKCEVTPFPNPTVSDSYSRTNTTDYYLTWRSKAGTLEKVLLATQIDTYTSRSAYTSSGQYVTGYVMNVTKNFILYAYQIYNSSDATLVSTNFGVIDINTGERKEFSYTPAQTMGYAFGGSYYYYSPTFFMYLPKDESKQPPE